MTSAQTKGPVLGHPSWKKSRGAVFVDELDSVPDGATVVFSAHGVSPAVWAQAASRGLETIDATCPLVTKVRAEARRFAARGDTVVLIGHAGHEEIEGTLGEAPDQTILVQSVDDAAEVFNSLRQVGGLSGYPSRTESVYDVIENSHASTALSYADGLAKAFAVQGITERRVVAIVGDGALTGGMCSPRRSPPTRLDESVGVGTLSAQEPSPAPAATDRPKHPGGHEENDTNNRQPK